MRPLRNPHIQGVLAWLLASWMRFCFATIRWTQVNATAAEQIWADGGGVVCAFWHSRIALSPACWPLDRAQPAKALISLSPDGQFIARAVGRLGIPAIRGSSANRDKADRAKGGSQALRDGLKQLKVGALGVTPDGPRGPVRVMAEGFPLLARLSGAPVLLIGLSCNPAIRLNSWDGALVPLPFGRGAIVWEATRYPDGAELADVAIDWARRLTAVEAEADAITGLEPSR
ncbi:MAG: lysophospholipid acyltransferase family protein [Brevundimonas sp.]|uniref:lysophospholipid acyltransferase family protein n=1 Tax=Brevundimonas sp. TaxID=1871086 RepID=UPI00276C1F9C|nr:lysophospholipid acyltransferase family protein [Brevundimonas sp.]